MLIFDTRRIGDRLLAQRKRAGLTQAEPTERARPESCLRSLQEQSSPITEVPAP